MYPGTMTVTFNIRSKCKEATLTASSPTDQNYFLGSLSTYTIPAFTISYITNPCSLTYSLLNSDGTAIDSTIFTFAPLTRVLTMSSSDTLKKGTYEL